jgi:hypothetical protein
MGDMNMLYAYQVSIKMNEKTLALMKENDYKLYAFRAVEKKGGGAGKPLVWKVITDILSTNTMSWNVSYGGYISTQSLDENSCIDQRDDQIINLGDTFSIDNKGVPRVISGTGTKGTIAFHNESPNDYTCGISEYAGKDTSGNDIFNPMCGFTILHGDFSDLITPITRLLLMFATDTIETATVIEKALSSGIVVDLSASNKREVTYDEAGGWSADNLGESIPFASNSDMSPLLINPAIRGSIPVNNPV